MEDVVVLVLVEDADAGRLRTGKFNASVVVFHSASGELLRREGGLVVVVEIRAVGRHPIELPAHAVLEGFDLGQRRAGYSRERDITLRKMHQRSVSVVYVAGAAGTPFLPLGTEHEVVDDQLASAVEEVGERFLARGRIKDIVLLDLHPGKLAALGGNGVALASELLFARE